MTLSSFEISFSDKEIIQVKENNLTIAEIEHWLCEFFKYVRFLNGKKLRKNITFKSNNYF